MDKLEEMDEVFKESKQVFLTTKNVNNELTTRPMTNYNESPNEEMWFPSFKDTKKVKDIENNPQVIISFPAKEEGKWYKIKGSARLAPWEEVRKMWRWWLLEWIPEEERKPLRYDNPFLDRSIIWVKPKEAYLDDNK